MDYAEYRYQRLIDKKPQACILLSNYLRDHDYFLFIDYLRNYYLFGLFDRHFILYDLEKERQDTKYDFAFIRQFIGKDRTIPLLGEVVEGSEVSETEIMGWDGQMHPKEYRLETVLLNEDITKEQVERLFDTFDIQYVETDQGIKPAICVLHHDITS